MLDNITKHLLKEIADLHKMPSGAVSFRKNGKSQELVKKNLKIGLRCIDLMVFVLNF